MRRLRRGARRCRPRRACTGRSRSRSQRGARRAPRAAGSGGRSRAGTCTPPRRAGRGREAARCGRTTGDRTARATPRGVVISRIPSRPPGRSTRRSSRTPASRSATLRIPKPTTAASKLASVERQREHVALDERELGRLAPRALEHRLGEVEADDARRAGVARRDREIAGAAARVEDAVAGPHRLAHRRRAPALVEAGRHDAVHRVVDRRDPVEHPPDAVRREAPRLDHYACPQRGVSCCSRPSWSSARATTKSTRSATVSAPW